MEYKLIDAINEQLKTQVLNLIDDLLTICPDEPDVLLVRLFFSNSISPEYLMDSFIHWVYPWKNHILEKNEDFFIKNDHVFGPLPKDKVKYFKVKIEDGTFDEEDKKVLWDYFEVFIKLIERYNKLK